MELRRRFTEHPGSVGETYGEHFKVALGVAGTAAVAAAAAAVHGVFPSLCTTTASDRICALHETITTGARGAARADTAA
jgi:hypothetical protein